MIQEMIDRVKVFHEKHGFPVRLGRQKHTVSDILLQAASDLEDISKHLFEFSVINQEDGDGRQYRAHLMVEELAELVRGMGNRDEEEVLDGGIDLLYVLLGTLGATYDLPVEEAWEEVCRSNESKAVRRPDDPRMRDKGPDYFTPDIPRIIEQYKCEHDWVTHPQDTFACGARNLICTKCKKEGMDYA